MNQMKFPVITIAREYGAGGRSVASLLAEKLNIPWYDKDFIITTAENSGLSIEQISKDSEEIGDREKFIDTLIGGGSMHDKVFYAQREVIIDLAHKPCIIIGRAAEAILKEAGLPSIDIFLYSDMKSKIQHAKELNEYGTMDVEKYVLLKDKKRENFYKQYTGKEFTDKHNYDICLNTSIGFEQCATILETLVHQLVDQKYFD